MSNCRTCGNQSWLCQQCKMDELEERLGTATDRDADRWVLADGLWHASIEFDGGVHLCGCAQTFPTPVERVSEDLRYVPDEYDVPVCRDCVGVLEGARAENVPDDVEFERAGELRADGGLVEVYRRETVIGTNDGIAIGERAAEEVDDDE